MEQIIPDDSPTPSDLPALDGVLLQSWANQLREWAPDISARGADHATKVRDMIQQVEGFARSMDPEEPQGEARMTAAIELIKTFGICFKMRDRNNLKHMIKQSILIAAPLAMKKQLLQCAEQKADKYKKSKISRRQIYLDAAIMLHRQRYRTVCSRVYWVDSSPQLRKDFLLIREVAILVDKLAHAHTIHNDIVRRDLAGDANADPDLWEQDTSYKDLHAYVQFHMMPVVGLGSGAASLSRKVAAFLSSFVFGDWIYIRVGETVG